MTHLEPHQALCLHKRAQAGDQAARDALILGMVPVAEWVCARYVSPRCPMGDLSAEAMLGVIEAVDTWDPSRAALTTHVAHRVRAGLSRWVKRRVRQLDHELSSDAPPVEHAPPPSPSRAWECERVRAAHEALSMTEYVIVGLRDLRGWSEARVAEHMQRGVRTVRRIRDEAHAKMREAMR